MEFSSQNTGVGSLSFLQGILPMQGLNPGLPLCSQILYQLSHKRSPRILERVAYPFSRGFPNPGSELGSPALQADSSTTELCGKPTARILEWCSICSSSGPCLSELSTVTHPSWFIELSKPFCHDKAVTHEGDKKWCFWIVVLKKTLESPLDTKEIKLVNSKGNQPWILIGKTDAEVPEAPILWPPDTNFGKDPDACKDWRKKKREIKDEMIG